MSDFLNSLWHMLFDFTDPAQNRLVQTAVILILLGVVRWVLYRLVSRHYEEDAHLLYVWRKVVEYVVVLVGMALIGRIWLRSLQSFATYFGLVSAGIAIALQDLVTNLAGWLFLLLRRPFSVGDRIELGEYQGDVIDMRLFQFSLLEIGNWVDADQSTGRIIHVPNNRIFKDMLANYSQGLPYIWTEISVTITFESDWEKAKQLLTAVLDEFAPPISHEKIRRAQRDHPRFVISYKNVSPIVYTKVVVNGVRLTLRFLVEPRYRRGAEQALWEAILRAFAQHHDVEFAYPTERKFIHYLEQKRPMEE